MPNNQSFAVVGAGIIGAAVARELTLRFPGSAVTVFEKEAEPAAHQTGHNSGVVHAGLYYEPGGLKARLCRRGVTLLQEFCTKHELPYEECGKIVVALDEVEERRLQDIYARATANGVPGVRLLDQAGIREIEPNAVGRAALHSPHTAIVDYAKVTRALVDEVTAAGGTVRMGTEVLRVTNTASGATVHTRAGGQAFDLVVVCSGLQSDRLAKASDAADEPSIVPFFGQYFVLEAAYRQHVKGLIYPVPDPKYPFLGVHLTKRIDGEMMVGPNAFLSFSREIYRGLGINPKDSLEVAANPGFWKFAARNLPTAVREIRSVVSKGRFLCEAQKYVPSLADADATRATRGIRAQAMTRDGALVDDFVIQHQGRVTHIRNAPSPGATSSLAIAEHIVDAAIQEHSLTSAPPAG
ncbi:L-2-hydroxyglutarate oxidase [Arthrobacter caoxuetaonis]|uniref:L-2-hydroxyglutarate oxidase n=1 Tax=Arthrobacter caoxuetaonis TaxID=2886935 RepID=A0A9X1SCB4_9MICC|nr:L-2-hydroxyglutarate oxidase [Arthrobacter caoxuetaonis]MCC3298450.1 L-2-hydroxyglutarate oxidase [Arthrobacter caoxuetaonis]USQ57537.1 L-2-hydroxyglutarate oxidase [Arthrobacter caoxuetaonis]